MARPGHDGKKRYKTQEAAEAAIARQPKSFHTLKAYPCRFCPDWHIGHDTRYGPRTLARALELALKRKL